MTRDEAKMLITKYPTLLSKDCYRLLNAYVNGADICIAGSPHVNNEQLNFDSDLNEYVITYPPPEPVITEEFLMGINWIQFKTDSRHLYRVQKIAVSPLGTGLTRDDTRPWTVDKLKKECRYFDEADKTWKDF